MKLGKIGETGVRGGGGAGGNIILCSTGARPGPAKDKTEESHDMGLFISSS